MRSCGATTEIIMSMELRRKEDLDFFKRLVEVGFLFEKVGGFLDQWGRGVMASKLFAVLDRQ